MLGELFASRLLEKTIAALFPHHESTGRQTMVEGNESVLPPVTKEELLKICGKIDDNEAPVLDSISNRLLKLAVGTGPELSTNAFKASLKEAIFPVQDTRYRS